ncbi:class A beta-lactamase [Rhodococcus olei]|uniref:Class A beta-lactamase n=2 Tax=Rhodococcus olei TaxID=2161675 RepID=A0ABP8PCT6_9NOCA
MCSTFKTYATAEVLRRTAAGTASLEESIAIEPVDLVEDSPVTSAAVGTSMTVRQLAEAALTRSDNTAGNQLLERIGGPAAVTALARDIGDDSTRLDRWEPELNAALRGDPRDTSTTRELADGYRALLIGDALAPAERAQLVDWLRASTTSDKRIRAGLPTGWTAADKTGAGRFGTVNDVGVVWDPAGRPLVLAVLTDSLSNREDAPRNNQVIADTTAAVIRALRG